MLRLLVKLSVGVRATSSAHDKWKEKDLHSDIPSDPRTMLDSFKLKPHVDAFVCCPTCYALYPIVPGVKDSYPETCTHRDMSDGDVCGRILRRTRTIKGKTYSMPSRRVLVHRMKMWLGSLLCRPGHEDILDATPSVEEPVEMADIMDSPGLREFLGPDNKPFIFQKGNYVFSMNMDGFNLYRNKEAGKKVTTGAIYMVCLNLPPSLRYLPENVFIVAIIPGPGEPSVHQINHILKPVVSMLLEFWNPGVHYSSTPNYPNGRTVHRCRCPSCL